MAKKYFLRDDITCDFGLIAIHSVIEGFSLAYILNKTLKGKFKRSFSNEIINSANFEFFKWEIKKENIDCSLISNQKKIKSKIKKSNTSLFFFEETKKVSLIDSLENVDYFIKINSGLEINFVVEKIKSLPEIILSYIINNKKIKSKFNLIID